MDLRQEVSIMRRNDDETRKQHEERVGCLNSLLRGELSAVETYRQVLDKVTNDIGASDLRRIEGEHREAVSLLRSHVVMKGSEPDATSGAWGTWAKSVMGASKAFGV